MMQDMLDLLQGTLGVLAQGVPAPTTKPQAEAPWYVSLLASPLFPLVIGLGVLYLFVFRSKRKQDKERQNLLDSVKKGDQIETIGGLFGTVLQVDDKSVVLKVDETANVKMRFNRRAIHRVIVEEGKSEK
jgi:preprotein translocase subunit YajC